MIINNKFKMVFQEECTLNNLITYSLKIEVIKVKLKILMSILFVKYFTSIIVARLTCDEGWKLEYHGYLMAGYFGHNAGTAYTCVDSDPDTLQGGHTVNNGYLFYMVEAMCGSLKCPPYVNGREIVCVVCSLEK